MRRAGPRRTCREPNPPCNPPERSEEDRVGDIDRRVLVGSIVSLTHSLTHLVIAQTAHQLQILQTAYTTRIRHLGVTERGQGKIFGEIMVRDESDEGRICNGDGVMRFREMIQGMSVV